MFPVHEHRTSFHLFFSSLFSFINLYRCSTSCVKFIPNYFTLFVAIGNGTDYSFDCFSEWLLVCINATDFCVLILYSAALLYQFIFLTVLVEFLGFSLHKIISSSNSDNSTSLPIWMPFSPCSLIALAKISWMVLVRIGNIFLSGSSWKEFHFSPLSIMSAVACHIWLVVYWEIVFLVYWVFFLWKDSFFSRFIHMSIHCLGHFSPLPPFPSSPPCPLPSRQKLFFPYL
jgi:hypothetical protein